MTRLKRRITRAGHGPAWQPVSPSQSQVTGGQASPGGAPGSMPLAQILVYPEPGGMYVTAAYRGLAPVYTADGAAVPATAPGRWAQLAAAGRP